MADLVITLRGDAGDFKKQFDQAIASLNKFSNETKTSQGYIGSMESQLKLLKTQMRSASEQDLPALRTQFLSLKNAIREAQYGAESFTQKIGGQFDLAMQKASKSLFSMGNIIKAALGGFGVASIVSTFISATGETEAFDNAIKGLVQSFKDLGKTQTEIDISRSTAPLIERAQAFIGSRTPLDQRLRSELTAERAKLEGRLAVSQFESQRARAFAFKGGSLKESRPGMLSPEDEERIRVQIALLNQLLASINAVENEKGSTGGGSVLTDDPFYRAMSESKTSSTYDAFIFERRQKEIEERKEASRQRLIENDKIRQKEEDDRKEMERRIAQERVRLADRYSAAIANTFEDAVFAGLRGGFDQWLKNYMQTIGVRTLSGILRLAISSASGGSFGAGSLLGHIFGFAGGGEFYTKGPMPIIVGDNPGGIEKVTVEPISGRGTSGLKNGNLALAGGGTVMSSPVGGGGNVFEITLELDKVNLSKVLYMPNGVMDTINRMRANPTA